MLGYKNVSTLEEIKQILALQTENLPKNISAEEAKEQGFVTVQHNEDLLWRMNQEYPHVVAVDDGKVVGYTLVMTKAFKAEIPVLVPMFQLLDELTFDGEVLGEANYFSMGQVCVAKSHRGAGVFRGLYETMKTQLSPYFDFIITEISPKNTRSMQAHLNVGFQRLHQYRSPEDGEEWVIVIWDWRNLMDNG